MTSPWYARGPRGKSVHAGDGAPTLDAPDDDLYVDVSTATGGDLYRREGGEWVLIGVLSGPPGEPGEPGAPGEPGPANELSIGTVTSGPNADASITGTPPAQVLNLVLPQGPKGDDGADGEDGLSILSGSGAPTDPAPEGALYVDVSTGDMYRHDGEDWVFQINLRGPQGTGDITGPPSSTDNAVTRWDGTSGEVLQDSGVTIDDDDNLTVPGDITVGGTVDGRDIAADGAALDNKADLVGGKLDPDQLPELTKNDVGLDQVDNTADLDKPVSTAVQEELNGKADTVHPHVIGDVTGLADALAARVAGFANDSPAELSIDVLSRSEFENLTATPGRLYFIFEDGSI